MIRSKKKEGNKKLSHSGLDISRFVATSYSKFKLNSREFLSRVHIVFLFCLFAGIMGGFQTQLCFGQEPQQSVKKKSEKPSNIYRVGKGDRLEIITWKEPDLSREDIVVRIDGKITFPLLGDIQASDLTTMQLKYDIEAGLKGYVDHPVVTVTVREPASQRYYILGEVLNSGEYPIAKGITVLQALAIAGGFTEWASKSEIIILRQENNQKRTIKIKYKNIIKGKDFSQNVLLRANDTIIVP